MIRRAVRLLGSIRFTLFLIISLSSTFLLGLWIPQKGLLKKELYLQWKAASPAVVSFLETLGLTDIYTSPITLSLWFLFFLNLLLVMRQRLPAIKKRISLPDITHEMPALSAYRYQTSMLVPEDLSPASIRSALRKEGYRFYGTAHRFTAVKNRLSPLATLLFHLSFILILLGGITTVYTRFSGTLDLAEGETFSGDMNHYGPSLRLPKIGSAPDARFVIEEISPEMERGTPTRLKVSIRDRQGGLHVAEINKPYKTGNTSFVIKDLGVAPLVILYDKKGRELDGAFVKLNVLSGRQDAFVMSGFELTVDYYPDYVEKDGTSATRSEEMNYPAFQLHIQQDKRFIARRIIKPGEHVKFGDYGLSLPKIVYWVRFYVVKERGLWIVYAGFCIATAALIWRLVFHRREIAGSIKEQDGVTRLQIAGRAEFFEALFEDEFFGLVNDIETAVCSMV